MICICEIVGSLSSQNIRHLQIVFRAKELQQGYEWTDNGLQTKPGQEVQIEELDFEFMEDVEVDTDQPRKVEVITSYNWEMNSQKGTNQYNDQGTVATGAFGSVCSQDTTKLSSVSTSPLDAFSPDIQQRLAQNDPHLIAYIQNYTSTASPPPHVGAETSVGGNKE